MKNPTIRSIILIWLAWIIIIIGFQALATARFQPTWPDKAQEWTTKETGPKYQQNRIYLLEPFMNNQVAWDSEYYLGTAIGGYENPHIPAIVSWGSTIPAINSANPATGKTEQGMPLSYAFFPFYSWLIWLFAIPLGVLGLNAIATATLAGVLVSALGTLAAMLALYDLAKDSLGEDGGLRAAFYLIIFPTGFFLAQVYTEGVFVGLAFTCLAMLKRGNWLAAALLGMAATLTRAVGIALVIPLAITWIRTREWYALDLEWRQIYHQGLPWRPLWRALVAFAPLIAFLAWKFSYLGIAFDFVESNYFGRGFLDIGGAFYAWGDALRTMLEFKNLQHSAYYFTEFFGMAIGLVAILRSLKTHPEVAWFSLAVFLISWGSGPAQGIHRYVLGAPAVFITLARWGQNPAFDRAWTIASTLLMGLLATLFAFNYWVA
jgi:hypothetical protein